MKKRFVVSTIGTSLLTNQITPDEREAGWYQKLRDTANLRREQLDPSTSSFIESLRDRAGGALRRDNVNDNRRLSAELNGIYGLYANQLQQGGPDFHYLIATDTAQGQATAEIVREFLHGKGISGAIYTPAGLSTDNTRAFSGGIKALIKWCEVTVPAYREDGYQVIFNLVGGFKSIQGYLNTIGMFYADEIVYIFEAASADLIRIPRLPIQVDYAALAPYTVPFALMAEGWLYPVGSLPDSPEALVEDDGTSITLSEWGILVWNRARMDLLKGELLEFPGLEYAPSFRADFSRIGCDAERVKLQETLATVCCLLDASRGDIGPLKTHTGLLYENYANRNLGNTPIGHFRVTLSVRVSCVRQAGKLLLRHYGREEEVNSRP